MEDNGGSAPAGNGRKHQGCPVPRRTVTDAGRQLALRSVGLERLCPKYVQPFHDYATGKLCGGNRELPPGVYRDHRWRKAGVFNSRADGGAMRTCSCRVARLEWRITRRPTLAALINEGAGRRRRFTLKGKERKFTPWRSQRRGRGGRARCEKSPVHRQPVARTADGAGMSRGTAAGRADVCAAVRAFDLKGRVARPFLTAGVAANGHD
jgi:hypothetical protein